MRRLLPWLGLWMLAGSAVAEPSGDGNVGAAALPKSPWIGLGVGQLEDSMRAHAPGVPAGIGFLVASVDPAGPAHKAGVRPYDILWRLDDQMLVNEAQFAALLAIRKPGDKVNLAIIRSAKNLNLELSLEDLPKGHGETGFSPLRLPLLPSGAPGMPRTIVYPRIRTAETTREDGSVARLHYQDEKAFVVIENPGGKVIYNGPAREGGSYVVPEDWKCSVGALERGLYNAAKKEWKPRNPRPRVVHPADGGDRRSGEESDTSARR